MKRLLSLCVLALGLSVPLLAQDVAIDVVPGKVVRTYGFADLQNGGAGIAYPDTDNIIVIDDRTYPNPVDKRKAFTNAIASGRTGGSGSERLTEDPAIIVLSGTVDLSDGKVTDKDHSYWDEYDAATHQRLHRDIEYEIGANKAIVGADRARVAYGGLAINGHADNPNLGRNVIIRNVEFWDSHGSTEYDTKAKGTFRKGGKDYPYADKNNKASSNNLGIGYGDTYKGTAGIPENIWIDHCTFSDGACNDMVRNFAHDGALDIPFGRNITVSYCVFTNHDKVSLVGSNSNLENPDERVVTFHHICYRKVTQRNPLLRASRTHVYNNLYDNIGVDGNSGYAIGVSQGALSVVENNSFGSFRRDTFFIDDGNAKGSPLFSRIFMRGNTKTPSETNSKENKNGLPFAEHLVDAPPFVVPYEYAGALEDAKGLKKSLPKRAGAGVAKTVRVNGTEYAARK